MLLEIQKHINKAIEMVCKEDIWYVITDAYIPSGVEIIVHMQHDQYCCYRKENVFIFFGFPP